MTVIEYIIAAVLIYAAAMHINNEMESWKHWDAVKFFGLIAGVFGAAIWLGSHMGWYVFLTVPGIAAIVFTVVIIAFLFDNLADNKKKREFTRQMEETIAKDAAKAANRENKE